MVDLEITCNFSTAKIVGIACHFLDLRPILSAPTSCGQTTFRVGGDYTPVNEYI
jgi:hypothetical protein